MSPLLDPAVADLLRAKCDAFERPDFIADDPICVPDRFRAGDPEDVAVAGFFAATIAWGNRRSIVADAQALLVRMDDAPAAFVRGAKEAEVQRAVAGWGHRTFKPEDAVGFVLALQQLMEEEGTFEAGFLRAFRAGEVRAPGPHPSDRFAAGIGGFRDAFLAGVPLKRTAKHIADPRAGSAAKRLCMFLRWMVRPAGRGVDFGVWRGLQPAELHIPLDVHTASVGRRLGLLTRAANDWRAVVELTEAARALDPVDPARFDFALFGLGAVEGF